MIQESNDRLTYQGISEIGQLLFYLKIKSVSSYSITNLDNLLSIKKLVSHIL